MPPRVKVCFVMYIGKFGEIFFLFGILFLPFKLQKNFVIFLTAEHQKKTAGGENV